MDLLTHWNLQQRPFEATWDTRFYFQSREHEEALNRMYFLVEEQTMNIGLLTGEVGCGKTLTRAVFINNLDPGRFTVVVQENSNFTFKELLQSVLRSIDDPPKTARPSKFTLYEQLRAAVTRMHGEGRHLVLVFDEAQEMSTATMNELKLLTNFNGNGQTCVTLILLGQPELRRRVAQLPPIDQRISLRFHLGPLPVADVGAYLSHRLRVAGHPSGELFDGDAAVRAGEAARGVPRALNRLAKFALEHAWLGGGGRVTRDAVEAVVGDLERQRTRALA